VSLSRAAVPAPSRHIRGFAWLAGVVLCYSCIALLTVWSCAALFLDLPFPKLRVWAVIAYGLASAAILWRGRRPLYRLAGCFACFSIVLAWWLSLQPSNDKPWQADVSKTAWAEVHGSQVTIHNFRSCDYRSEFDYTCQWLTRTADLNRISGVDLFMNYWGSPWIAHTILSFDIANGEHIVFSIETRKQIGQTYSALRGFFRQYTLISVVSDERDVVRLRTNYRHGEDLYLFHTNATPAFARALFMNYIEMTNRLHEKPQWYNALTHNCTTEIYTLGTMKDQPWDWRILFNGKADEMEYERGELAGGLPWKQLKQRAYVNPAAQAADSDANFSEKIRENRPGFGPPEAVHGR
jgi:Domain of unknown function (DUF4105)